MYDNYIICEVKGHLAAAIETFYDLRKQLNSRSLQTKAKFVLYKTLILPFALHVHDSWTLKEVVLRVFDVFEHKMLLTTLGSKEENDIL